MSFKFPQTHAQKLPVGEVLKRYIPRHFHAGDVIKQLIEREPAKLVGESGMHRLMQIEGTETTIHSSVNRIGKILLSLDKEQIGPRTKDAFEVFRSAGGEELDQDIALYRVDGVSSNITGSLRLLEEHGIELAHPWTVITLRTQRRIANLIQKRQEIGIPEVLLAGHFMHVRSDETKIGSPTDLFYVQDTFASLPILDQTRPKPDGRGFKPGTAIWVGTRVKSEAVVPVHNSGEPPLEKAAEAAPVG